MHYSDTCEVIRASSALLLCALSTRCLVVKFRLLPRKLLERQVGDDIPRVADADGQEQRQPLSQSSGVFPCLHQEGSACLDSPSGRDLEIGVYCALCIFY
jgi:hypothetical protein